MLNRITADKAYFIKLGSSGEWEHTCLRDGTLRLGYRETPHELCVQGRWDAVRAVWLERRGDAGAATRDANQIRAFYEADESVIFVTFADGLLHWCKPTGPVEVLSDRSHVRATVDGWHHQSVSGVSLSSERLSGHLLKVQMFRGTICDIRQIDYLLRKINGELSPEVAAAEVAERALMDAIGGLMRLLTWQDFELLVDLVFSASGWRRIGVLGKAQKTVDLELVLPTTGERAFVQIKSKVRVSDIDDYVARFDKSELYDRMFFVWHSGEIDNSRTIENVTFVGPEQLSRMVIDAGLSSWLREKVS